MTEFIVATILNGLITSVILMLVVVLIVLFFQDSDFRNTFIWIIIVVVMSFVGGLVLRHFGINIL